MTVGSGELLALCSSGHSPLVEMEMPFPAERLISWSTTFPRGHGIALLSLLQWAIFGLLQGDFKTAPPPPPPVSLKMPSQEPFQRQIQWDLGGSTCQTVPCPLQVTGRRQDCQCHGQRKAWIARAWETPGLRGLRQDCWGRLSFPNSVPRGAKPLRHRFTAFFLQPFLQSNSQKALENRVCL